MNKSTMKVLLRPLIRHVDNSPEEHHTRYVHLVHPNGMEMDVRIEEEGFGILTNYAMVIKPLASNHLLVGLEEG